MERNNTRVRPHHRLIAKIVWPIWIFWVRFRRKRYIVRFGMRPALLELRMPEWEVLQPEDLPYTIFFDVLVLINATFPPLHESTGMCIFDALMCASGHLATETTFRSRAI